MNIVGIIPARMASSRFPGKPLALIHGMPMIGHTFLRSKMSKIMTKVFVATCDNEIKDYIESIGGDVIMTKNTHPSAADRTVEAIDIIESQSSSKVDIIILIQGDDPMITPESIDDALKVILDHPNIGILTLVRKINDLEEFNDQDIVKVISDLDKNAIYFTREAVPSLRKGADPNTTPMFKHVAIILFTRNSLERFSKYPQTPLELAEEIDLIRVIEYGEKIRIEVDDSVTYNVDTPKALKIVEDAMADDTLIKNYLY